MGRGRNLGVDVARGAAVVLMIETHAYDGWVHALGKASWGYALSRVLSNIPAALFLLLAGVGLALAAAGRDGTVRPRLARRALGVIGWGYVISLVYAAIEGVFRPAELLRADILHCIGLSLLVCTWLLIGRCHMVLRAVVLTGAALAGSILLPRLLPPLPAVLAVPAALILDVVPYTRFPLLPLVGFCAIGVAVGDWLARGQPSPRRALLLGAGAAMLAVVFTWATGAAVRVLGGTLSRAHPAVVFNLLNGACRALCVLFLGIAAAGLRSRAVRWPLAPLAQLGRGSLLAYAFHIPFCYGRLSAPWAARLDMAQATAALVGLVLLTWGVVRARDGIRSRLQGRLGATARWQHRGSPL
ncbi:MAG: heparan-alpha-glucosaminide N-acetyltransferase domain-containing protein [Myxococcales bacterium]|nr:DUF1624 domain-containing protein [Myxococcota bacterium]MDW8282972.1 heparan-alpha-glucosaminide N-acetyltransferase domain-containing protein [Myxococcales bacterium]